MACTKTLLVVVSEEKKGKKPTEQSYGELLNAIHNFRDSEENKALSGIPTHGLW